VCADGPFSSDTSNFHFYKCAGALFLFQTHQQNDEITAAEVALSPPPPNIMGASDNNNNKIYSKELRPRAAQ
jgi:hypothetical protein